MTHQYDLQQHRTNTEDVAKEHIGGVKREAVVVQYRKREFIETVIFINRLTIEVESGRDFPFILT